MEQIFYDVYDIDKKTSNSKMNVILIKSFSDKKEAERKVFAENSSYRKTEDKFWYIKERVMVTP